MLARHELNLEVIIRHHREEDTKTMQWAGAIEFASVFENAFARVQKGEVIMLVAEVGGFPVGRLWIDITRKSDQSKAIFYALQVIWVLRSRGIGTKLMEVGEQLVKKLGLKTVELGVKKDNQRALELYQRLGWHTIGEELSVWDYVDPSGVFQEVKEEVWTMEKNLG